MTSMLDYPWSFRRTPDAAWQVVKQNGSLSLVPYEELKANVFVHTIFGNVMDAATAFNTEIELAGAIARRSSDAAPRSQYPPHAGFDGARGDET